MIALALSSLFFYLSLLVLCPTCQSRYPLPLSHVLPYLFSSNPNSPWWLVSWLPSIVTTGPWVGMKPSSLYQGPKSCCQHLECYHVTDEAAHMCVCVCVCVCGGAYLYVAPAGHHANVFASHAN